MFSCQPFAKQVCVCVSVYVCIYISYMYACAVCGWMCVGMFTDNLVHVCGSVYMC